MKITRRQLRRLIKESQNAADTQSILEAHATIAYFYGYVAQLLVHARTADYSHFTTRFIGDIDISLSGILEESGMLRAHAGAKAAQTTGKSQSSIFFDEAQAIAQEGKENASLKIRESFGDAYAHLLKLAYVGNDVLGTMTVVDAGQIVHPGIQMEWRFDDIESQLQNDKYLNAMDSIT